MGFPRRKLMMQATTLREADLMRRTAWNMIRHYDAPMTASEREVYGARGKKLVVYIACLNDTLIDLEMELDSVGLFRHQTKRNVKRAQEIAMQAHTTLYTALDKLEGNAGKWYNNRYEISAKEIKESVYLEAPHKSYSIAMALLRLIKKLNDSLGRFVNKPSESLEAISKLIADIPAEDRKIDGIVDNHIKYE